MSDTLAFVSCHNYDLKRKVMFILYARRAGVSLERPPFISSHLQSDSRKVSFFHFFTQTFKDCWGRIKGFSWYVYKAVNEWELMNDLLAWVVGIDHEGGKVVFLPPSGESPFEILIIFLFGRERELGSSWKHPWTPSLYLSSSTSHI